MPLKNEIDQKRREIRTDGYSMSIGEWVSLYEKKELDIHPEFQRIYRWTENQKTNLIESIILGIPIPPIFVSQREDGVWDVVDGLQRLSTIFQLMGILKDEKDNLVPPLVLQGTKYLPSLQNLRWSDLPQPQNELPSDVKLALRRSKIAVSIILKESDVNAKYDLFQRLNTGGSVLSPQETRNCLLVMLNSKMYEWISILAKHKSFQDVMGLSERLIDEAYDMEMVLRFMVLFELVETDLQAIGDVGVFLTERMTGLARDTHFQYDDKADVFRKTFDALASTVADNAFKRYNTTKARHEGGFLVSQFEVVALGIAYNIQKNTLVDTSSIPAKVQGIWSAHDYTDWAGTGITASRRLPRLVPFGRKLFAK